jgi:predicted DsbA family dithiol-disulfide isomerase
MKMKVEIWSDVVCPFCYIGKRKFEAAMERFAHKDEIEIIWKSYQLSPDAKHEPGKDIFQYLADMKGQSLDWSKQMHDQVAQMARAVGLDYHFERVKPANTFDAHRVIQLAKKRDLGGEMEERLFKAYFTDGELISDQNTLIKLAGEVGLDKDEVANMLEGENYIDAVERDIEEAARLGARGVPFFVMNGKYGVSGAQDPSVFLQTLDAAYNDWKK